MVNQMSMTGQEMINCGEPVFYKVADVMKMTGWSEKTVLQMFHDPQFPASDLGKAMLVEGHALIAYFSQRRTRDTEKYWRKGDLKNELRRRAG